MTRNVSSQVSKQNVQIPTVNPNPPPYCSERGCTKSATWRIETQDEDGEYIDIHVCDEHYPQDPAINEAFVSVKRIRHSTGTEFQEDYIK